MTKEELELQINGETPEIFQILNKDVVKMKMERDGRYYDYVIVREDFEKGKCEFLTERLRKILTRLFQQLKELL